MLWYSGNLYSNWFTKCRTFMVFTANIKNMSLVIKDVIFQQVLCSESFLSLMITKFQKH